MPVSWDLSAKHTLLLMLLAQKSPDLSIFKTYDAGEIAQAWPRTDSPTPRAIQEQIKKFRAQVKNGQFTVTETPSRSFGGNGATPKKVAATGNAAPVTPTKRSFNAKATPTSSAKKQKTANGAKKRGVKDSEESEEVSLTEEDEAQESGNGSSDDGADKPLAAAPKVTERRILPERPSKSRSRSYAAEEDSAGEDAAAKNTDSEDGEEYMSEKEKEKGRRALGQLLRTLEGKSGVARNGVEEAEEEDEEGMEGVEGDTEDCEEDEPDVDTDAESKRMSWKSALENQEI